MIITEKHFYRLLPNYSDHPSRQSAYCLDSYLFPFILLCILHSIWQFLMSVAPPLPQAVTANPFQVCSDVGFKLVSLYVSLESFGYYVQSSILV